MIIVAHGNIYTFLHSLMWVFFCSKCVKCVLFSILEDYKWADVVAPRALASMQKFPSILQ